MSIFLMNIFTSKNYKLSISVTSFQIVHTITTYVFNFPWSRYEVLIFALVKWETKWEVILVLQVRMERVREIREISNGW